MKEKLKPAIIKEGKLKDDAARVVAELFNCSPAYVRMLVSGTRKPTRKKGKLKAKAILRVYWAYKDSKSLLKSNLIKAIEKAVAV